MEFLFTNQIASIEALIVFLCVGILFLLFAYDAILYLKNVVDVFFPRRKAPLIEALTENGEVPSTQSIIESLEEKNILENISGDVSLEEVVLDNPILQPEEPTSDISSANEGSSSQIISEIVTETPEPPSSHVPDAIPGVQDGREKPNDNEVQEKSPIPEKSIEHKEEPLAQTPTNSKRSSKKDKIIEIINTIKTLIARGQIDDARALLVSGLSIDKNHRELNLLMATLYERDHAFSKAEFILKDIALNHPDDIEILTHLATDLAMQRKYEVAYELYKKILSLGEETEEVLYTLTHLSGEMGLVDDTLLYARAYLKGYPHNPEILWIYAEALIAKTERKEAIEILIKLKNLTPYNQEIADLIQKLVTEEELAGNFGGEK